MTLGFLGTGNIASALVRGLCGGDHMPERILVSPRNAENAARLAGEFVAVEVALHNQAVLDGAETVFLSVLPKDLRAIVGGLRFRREQRVISLVALVPLAQIEALVAPAASVVRAVPIPSAARRLGPIALYPDEPDSNALLGRVGTVVPADSEAQLEALCAVTALIAPYYALMQESCDWLVAAGVGPSTAKAYVASMFHALSVLAEAHRGDGFAELVAEAQTPGGLNEQALREIRAAGAYTAFGDALDAILLRLGGTPPKR